MSGRQILWVVFSCRTRLTPCVVADIDKVINTMLLWLGVIRDTADALLDSEGTWSFFQSLSMSSSILCDCRFIYFLIQIIQLWRLHHIIVYYFCSNWFTQQARQKTTTWDQVFFVACRQGRKLARDQEYGQSQQSTYDNPGYTSKESMQSSSSPSDSSEPQEFFSKSSTHKRCITRIDVSFPSIAKSQHM